MPFHIQALLLGTPFVAMAALAFLLHVKPHMKTLSGWARALGLWISASAVVSMLTGFLRLGTTDMRQAFPEPIALNQLQHAVLPFLNASFLLLASVSLFRAVLLALSRLDSGASPSSPPSSTPQDPHAR